MLRRALLLIVILLAALPLAAPSTTLAAPTCFGKPATHVMTRASNSYVGTPGNDVVIGTNGFDYIDMTTFGGVDLVCGNGGNDRIYVTGLGSKADGGAGNDYVFASASGQAFGGVGNDEIRAGCCTANPSDPPALGDGGSGDDYVTADFDAIAKGGSGNDYLECVNNGGNAACVALEGGSGNDILINANTGATELIDCGSGRDKVFSTGAIIVRNCEGIVVD